MFPACRGGAGGSSGAHTHAIAAARRFVRPRYPMPVPPMPAVAVVDGEVVSEIDKLSRDNPVVWPAPAAWPARVDEVGRPETWPGRAEEVVVCADANGGKANVEQINSNGVACPSWSSSAVRPGMVAEQRPASGYLGIRSVANERGRCGLPWLDHAAGRPDHPPSALLLFRRRSFFPIPWWGARPRLSGRAGACRRTVPVSPKQRASGCALRR